jgi:hypothetical protein
MFLPYFYQFVMAETGLSMFDVEGTPVFLQTGKGK